MSRELRVDHPHAYRVVMEYGYGKRYIGPYATKAAAKGQLSTKLEYAHRWDSTETKGWIEKTSSGWEVDDV